MKKILIISVLVMALSGCDNKAIPINDKGDTIKESAFIGYRIEAIDGCEYIKFNGRSLTHKGNCKNKIHIYNEN